MTDIALIRAAALRLSGHARLTPLLNAPLLDRIAGRRIFVKAECLQWTGSFKYRGAWSAVSALAPEVRAKGVLAFSSGNHGQGVALGRCCTTLSAEDSHRESMRLDRPHEQAIARPIPHDKLVQLHFFAA